MLLLPRIPVLHGRCRRCPETSLRHEHQGHTLGRHCGDFLRTGGLAMLRMMNTPEEEMAQHDHAVTGHGGHEGHDVRTTAMGHADHDGYGAVATEQTGPGRAADETTLATDTSGYEEHTTHERY